MKSSIPYSTVVNIVERVFSGAEKLGTSVDPATDDVIINAEYRVSRFGMLHDPQSAIKRLCLDAPEQKTGAVGRSEVRRRKRRHLVWRKV